MYLMLQKETPDDFVIATGESRRLADFAAVAFAQLGLDPKDHLLIDQGLLRPTDIMTGQGNAEKAATKLGWKPRFKMEDVARMMVETCEAEAEAVSVPVAGGAFGDPNATQEHPPSRLFEIYDPTPPLLAH
jgi:GDP-D-mannose dehydratase